MITRLVPAATALIAVVAGAYVAARAVSVGFTYDEAYTLAQYVDAPLATIVGFQGAEANNHTLNSLAMRGAKSVAGSSELALRLPNVLAFAGYAIAVLALTRRLRHPLARLLAAALLLLNPFLLELFSLARGYGLGLCAMMVSLALLAPAADPVLAPRRALSRLAVGVGVAGLAVVANLAFLYFLVPYLIAACARGWSRWRELRTEREKPPAAVLALSAGWTAIVAVYGVVAIRRLQSSRSLYYGGARGFWSDTVDSLLRCWLYLQSYSSAARPLLLVFVVLVLVGGVWLAFRGNPPVEFLRLAGFLLLAGGALTVVSHALFGTPFLVNRTAAWMLPCFLWLAALELDATLSLSRGPRTAAAALGGILLVGTGVHAALSATLGFAILQSHDADTKQMLADLERLHAGGLGSGRSIALDASWELVPSIAYYRDRRPLPWLGTVAENTQPADAAFLSPRDAERLGRMTPVKRYERTGNVLAVAGAP